MRVLFDLSIVPHAVGGVSRYLISVANALSETASESGIDFIPVDVPAVHSGVPGPDIDCISLKTPFYLKIPLFRRIPMRLGLEAGSRSSRLHRLAEGTAVYHHSGVQPEFPRGSRSVITMYDLSALENPEWHTEETAYFASREAELIRAGSSVMAISNWTGKRVQNYFGLSEDRLFCAGGAADEVFSPGQPSPGIMKEMDLEPGRYLLHVGNFVPRKNIPFLLNAYRQSRETGVEIPLVLAGAGEWGSVKIEKGPGVRVLKNVSDNCMVNLYRGARALLCPSRFEGLGLPVLEAFACGTPVISSNAAALGETVGNKGILLEPDDTDGWVREICRLEEPERVAELRKLSSSAVRRNWHDIAEGICGFYRRISQK